MLPPSAVTSPIARRRFASALASAPAAVMDQQGAPRGRSEPLASRPPPPFARGPRTSSTYMNGGPSQVDTFDPKPALTHQGRPPPPTCAPNAALG